MFSTIGGLFKIYFGLIQITVVLWFFSPLALRQVYVKTLGAVAVVFILILVVGTYLVAKDGSKTIPLKR